MAIEFYEVEPKYINYLVPFAPHLFHNKKPGQQNERKYIGVVITVRGLDYFAPLSSYKEKHKRMKESLDFLKIGDYAVINLNNMFPVPVGSYSRVNIRAEKNLQYRKLLEAEYRLIRKMQDKILKNAEEVYKHKCSNGNSTSLAKRCNDFELLEKALSDYKKK